MLGTEGKLKRGKEGSVSFCLDAGGVCADCKDLGFHFEGDGLPVVASKERNSIIRLNILIGLLWLLG